MYQNKFYTNTINLEGAPKEPAQPGRVWLMLGLQGAGTEQVPLVKLEGLEPMAPEDFAKWLWAASQEPKQPARPLDREPKGIWRAEEQSKESLARMSKWREEWNRARRKYPTKSKKELDALVREKLAGQERFEANWKEALEQNLAELLNEI